jgi:hypothetical protein
MTDQEWLQTQSQIASDILGSARPADIDALEQLLRARTHPKMHEARAQLHRRLSAADPATKRRFVDAVSTDTVDSLHADIAGVEESYHRGELSTQRYIDFLLCIAVFEKGFFDEVLTVLLALESRQRLQNRLSHLSKKTTEEMLWREYQALQRELWEQRIESAPSLIRELEPIVIKTSDDLFLLPARVRLHDAISAEYRLDISEPRKAHQYNVRASVSIPWSAAQTGVLMHMAFPDEAGWHHKPVDVMLWPHQLNQMRQRGSAIPARIGPGQHISVHEDIFPVRAELGNDGIASIRVTTNGLEIRKTHPDLQLTVTV